MKNKFRLFKVFMSITLVLSIISGCSSNSGDEPKKEKDIDNHVVSKENVENTKELTNLDKVINKDVVPIDLSIFKKGKPTDEDSVRIEAILKNANKYGVGNWYNKYKKYNEQEGEYLSYPVKNKDYIREPVEMAYALAVALELGVYDEDYTGVSREEAIEKTIKMLKSIAKLHRVNSGDEVEGAWGDFWISASYATNTAFASWLLWEEFSEKDQENIKKMVEYEANRGLPVEYYRDKDGNVLRPGNSGAEENALNASVLGLATAMMPNHPNVDAWRKLLIVEMISAIARPSDVNNETVLHGKKVKDWIDGSNIEENGTLLNHGGVHPAYMSFIHNNTGVALYYILSGEKAPKASAFNVDILYKGLVDTYNEADPENPEEYPGGYIYVEGDWSIYYPRKASDDKGNSYIIPFVNIDIISRTFNADNLVERKHTTKNIKLDAAYWEKIHAQRILEMQQRFDDGHTYMTDEENNSEEHITIKREARMAKQIAQSYLFKWLNYQEAISFTNDDYGLNKMKIVPVTTRYQFETDIIAKTLSKGEAIERIKIKRNKPEVKKVSNSNYEYFKADEKGDFIEHTIKLEAPGTYNIKGNINKGAENGQYQLSVEGVDQGEVIDMYDEKSKWTIQEFGTKTFDKKGLIKFRFTVTGKNEKSKGYNAKIDYIELVPVDSKEK